ncbi:hypothetical protein AB1N83_004642 [Pleurotus pulmonarius]
MYLIRKLAVSHSRSHNKAYSVIRSPTVANLLSPILTRTKRPIRKMGEAPSKMDEDANKAAPDSDVDEAVAETLNETATKADTT